MNAEKTIALIPGMTVEQRASLKSNAESMLKSSADAAKIDAQAVLDALAAHAAIEREQRSARASDMPREELITEAFSRREMTETERKVVQVLLDNPGLSSTGLSKKLGWDAQTWHMHFGTMCKNRMADLWPAPRAVTRDGDFYSGILADLSDGTSLWTMKLEAVKAFAGLGLRAKGDEVR